MGCGTAEINGLNARIARAHLSVKCMMSEGLIVKSKFGFKEGVLEQTQGVDKMMMVMMRVMKVILEEISLPKYFFVT